MKIKILLSLLALFSLVMAQNKNSNYTYIDPYPSQYELFLYQNRFIIRNQISNISSSDAISVINYASGFVEYKGSYILLKISTTTYKLKIINDEKVLNIDLPLLAKDTLYATRRNSGEMVILGNWNNRKKEGTWKYIHTKNGEFIVEKKEIYKDGKLVKSNLCE